MATFGIYQVLDPLYVTPSGSVNSGKIVGGEAEGRIAVKIFNPPKPDPDEPNWEPKYFLDRAQVQRRVAAAGGAHWAPVYALGFTPDGGAYYVTDYHALTAQKMIDGRVPVDAAALHAIVRSALAGLEEVRRIAGRAHANLKPSNVLLVGKGPADELRAVLSDPGQEYRAQKEGEAGDLRAIGALIYALMLHRPPVNGDRPAAGEPAWERLGDKAEGWRQLCADLLAHPIPPHAATIAAVTKTVDGLAPPRLKVPHIRLPGIGRGNRVKPGKAPAAGPSKGPSKPRRARSGPRLSGKAKRRIVQALALVLLVGGGLGVLSMLEAGAREEVCAAREGWYGSLAAGLAEPQRRERFAADPHLRRVTEDVAEIEAAGVQCREGRAAVLGFLDFQKTRAAAAALRRVEQALAPESWPQLAKLRELAGTFEKRAWQQPAGYVAQLLEGVRPTPRPSSTAALSRPSTSSLTAHDAAALPAAGTLAQRIDRALRLQPIIEQQAAASDADWKQLDERAASLEASTDPVLKGFGAFLRRDAVAAVRLTDEGFEGFPQLKQNAGVAMQVLESLRATPPGEIDAVRFNEEVVRDLNPADVESAHVRRWLTQRPLYVIRRDDIAKAADDLQRRYDATAGEVAKSVPDPAEAPAFKVDQEGVEAALREFRQRKFIERDVAEGKLAERVAEIGGQIDLLKRYYHAEDAADWLNNLAGVATTSDRIKTRWEAWVDSLRRDLDAMAKDRELFAASKTQTDKLRDVLTMLELNVPPPPEGLSEAFAKAARERREEQMGELIRAINPADPALPPEDLSKAAVATAAWFEDLKGLSADFPVRKKLLTLEDRPDARWRDKPAFWKDAIVQRLIGKDVERIDRLQKLTRAPRQELVAAAKAEALRPEVKVAAWKLLGEKRLTPEWPATAEELEIEASLRLAVATEAKALDEAERNPLAEALAREGPRRWRRFIEAANSEPLLMAAVNRAETFGIDHVVLGDMSAAARFNFWLCAANMAIRDEKARRNIDLKKVVENLRIAAGQLEQEQPAAAQVLDKLARLAVPDPFADRGELPDRFQLAVKGLDRPIEFLRVEPKDGSRPFYLGTREVTLAQFAGAIEGANLWPEARKLPWPYRPATADARRGARVWEWADPQSPRVGVAQLWMTDAKRHNDFPREFHPEAPFNRNVLSPRVGGMPSEDHPMQYVSAHAALFYAAALGCRLPTSGEWRAALEASGKPLASGEWNLRDRDTWDVFRKHAAGRRADDAIPAENWPDRGAFPGDPPAGTAVSPAAARPGGDSAFLFRPAPSNDGTFADLVGNVAEYVCEVPDAFARWRDKRTADDVKRFLADTASGGDAVSVIAVVGGSALSPADVPPDKPLPVTRTDRGFSDVGLRLAFTAPARDLAERLRYTLAGDEYVWPRATASADTRTR